MLKSFSDFSVKPLNPRVLKYPRRESDNHRQPLPWTSFPATFASGVGTKWNDSAKSRADVGLRLFVSQSDYVCKPQLAPKLMQIYFRDYLSLYLYAFAPTPREGEAKSA